MWRGIVIVSFDPARMSASLKRLSINETGIATLIRSDGDGSRALEHDARVRRCLRFDPSVDEAMQQQSRHLRHREPDRQGREAVRVREAPAPSAHGHRGNRLRVLRPGADAMAAAQRLVDGTSRHGAHRNWIPDQEIRARRGNAPRAATGRGGASARGRTHTILVQQRGRLRSRLRPESVRAFCKRSGARIAGGPGTPLDDLLRELQKADRGAAGHFAPTTTHWVRMRDDSMRTICWSMASAEWVGPDCLVAVGFDSTDAENVERMLNQKARLTALGEIAVGIAHEVAQPLTIINFTTKRMEREPDRRGDPEGRAGGHQERGDAGGTPARPDQELLEAIRSGAGRDLRRGRVRRRHRTARRGGNWRTAASRCAFAVPDMQSSPAAIRTSSSRSSSTSC